MGRAWSPHQGQEDAEEGVGGPQQPPAPTRWGPYAVKPRMRLFFQMTRVSMISQTEWYWGSGGPSDSESSSAGARRQGQRGHRGGGGLRSQHPPALTCE